MKQTRTALAAGRAGVRRRACVRGKSGMRGNSSPTSGFALLITITLLAFIVVLLLGLAVYTRVETSIAGNTQRQAQARENALLALNVAIAQLQKHAGPDTRVTATAANFGAIDGTRHYTGIWSSNGTTSVPSTWLVSGNEAPLEDIPDPNPDAPAGSTIPAPLAVTPAVPGTRLQTLVGRNTTGDIARSANWVDAPLVDLTANGVPGIPATATTTIGRYAWWVGDQGVKAPVAIGDNTDAVSYAPFDSADLRQRIGQQITLGAGAAEASSGEPVFEPRDANNTSLVAGQKVAAGSQIAFLRSPSNAVLGLSRIQQNFHTWSPNNFNVLANTKDGGLRQDLSIAPNLLGTAFAAWANYPAYMEKFTPDAAVEPPADGEGTVVVTPTPVLTAPILPEYSADPVRRRYRMTPHLIDQNSRGSHQVGPVLNYFLLTFNVRTVNGTAATQPLEVRARWMLSFWNPYTSALVPENLRVEVTGLPTRVQVVNETPERAGLAAQFSLRDSFGTPLRINLPWDAAGTPADNPSEDRASWLAGRIYSWRSNEDTTKASDPPSEGYASQFYSQTLADSGAGVVRPISDGAAVDGDDVCHLEVSGSDQLTVTLYAVRPDGDVRLGRFLSPPFVDGFTTTTQKMGQNDYQFSYVFRLAESIDTPAAPATWLTTTERDLRRRTVPPEAYVVGENGNDPALYDKSYSKIRNPDRLLDRATNAQSYNEDVPLFELPRGPLLSVGALQHFRLIGQRPFMIGNSWGANFELNDVRLGALFDRYFFSGLVEGVVPATSATGDLILPNPLLKPLRNFDGTKPTIDDIRRTVTIPGTDATDTTPATEPMPSPAEGRSSKYFLQAGAFNLNSVNASAWASVLRGVRFPAPKSFSYLDVSALTGTADDATTASIQSTDAQFFRFPQSAQETYKAEPGLASNDADSISPANTHLFRRGMRTLTAAQVSAFAAKIVELVGVKHAAAEPVGGPIRSLEEFLSPSDLFAGVDAEGNPGAPRSLLEAAIADAGINADIAEFSSQWLTQGDVMTALAPILFPRSDTFVIRTYGEAVNPVKLPLTYRAGDPIPADAIEGRAWAEAIVQRLPEYFDRSDPPETLAPAFDAPSDPENPESAPTQAHQLNKQLGRRLKVVSFRWLTRADI